MAANAITPLGKLVVLGPRDAYQNGGSLQERLTQMEQLVASEGLRVVVAHVDPPASLFAGGRLPLDLVEAGVLVPYGLPEPNETLLGLAARLPQLKLVQLMSAGFDHVDIAGLDKHGVVVANNGGSNAVAVAEHTIGLILSLLRRLPEGLAHGGGGGWSRGETLPATAPMLWPRRELTGLTVGIVSVIRSAAATLTIQLTCSGCGLKKVGAGWLWECWPAGGAAAEWVRMRAPPL
jgi:hypothetical protein